MKTKPKIDVIVQVLRQTKGILPSCKEIEKRFGVSSSTAFRARRAVREELGRLTSPTPKKAPRRQIIQLEIPEQGIELKVVDNGVVATVVLDQEGIGIKRPNAKGHDIYVVPYEVAGDMLSAAAPWLEAIKRVSR